jgi:hypothetical protein
MPTPAALQKIMADVASVKRDMQSAGVWVFAGGLHPASTATVVRAKNGGTVMTDGPFTEGKEHIGGITVITASDLDQAIAWARKLSEATTTPIEVWPFRPTGGN